MDGLRTDKPNQQNPNVWRSFGANCAIPALRDDTNYNNHGHVGFAWGARRDVLEAVPLYDRALTGGADHIIAHAAAGQINHMCIAKSFTDDIDEVNEWSERFYQATQGKVGYVPGDLYHIWHGDIQKRDYFQRIKTFTPMAKKLQHRDRNGLYVGTPQTDDYMLKYMLLREVFDDGQPTAHHEPQPEEKGFGGFGGGHFGGGGAGNSEGWGDVKQDVTGAPPPAQSDTTAQAPERPPEFIPFS